jgi:acetyl-CoA synthetase
MLPQRPETAIAHMAVYRMGAVAVPLSFLFGPDALEYRLVHSAAKGRDRRPQSLANLAPIRDRCPGVRHVIGVAGARESYVTPWEDLLARASARHDAVATSPRDPALVVYTSGTTGPPKAALMPHACLIGNLPASCTRTTATRARATSSGRPPTGQWTGG